MSPSLVLPVSTQANGSLSSSAPPGNEVAATDFAGMLFAELGRLAGEAVPADPLAQLPGRGKAAVDELPAAAGLRASGRPALPPGLDVARLRFPEQAALSVLPAAPLAAAGTPASPADANLDAALAPWLNGLGNPRPSSDDEISAGPEEKEDEAGSELPLIALLTPPVDRPPQAASGNGDERPAPAAASTLLPLRAEGRPATPPGLEMLAARAASDEASANLAAPPASEPTFAETLQTAQAAAPASPAAKPAETPAAHTVRTPVHSPGWSNDFGERVVWMARNDQQSAQIQINPPQLGPVQITLSLNGDQASAVFASPHAEVRQAIEDALPRLREMLAGTGIALGDANVGAHLPQPRDNPGQFVAASRRPSEDAILSADPQSASVAAAPALLRGRGMVDLFA